MDGEISSARFELFFTVHAYHNKFLIVFKTLSKDLNTKEAGLSNSWPHLTPLCVILG